MAFKDRGPSSGPGATSWPALCTHSVSGPQLDVNNLTIEAGGQTQFYVWSETIDFIHWFIKHFNM